MHACPESVIVAGAHLVKVRHGVQGKEAAKNVGLNHNDPAALAGAFDDAFEHIKIAMMDLRQFGVMEMEFGPGLQHFFSAEANCEQMDMKFAWADILCAHNCFREVLDKYKIANPTNDEIAKVIAYGNWR